MIRTLEQAQKLAVAGDVYAFKNNTDQDATLPITPEHIQSLKTKAPNFGITINP